MSDFASKKSGNQKTSEQSQGASRRRDFREPANSRSDIGFLQRAAGNRATSQFFGSNDQFSKAELWAEIGQQFSSPISKGSPLDHASRNSMERLFVQDFSGVRIHSDDSAALLTNKLATRAFTVGKDIWFAPTAYAPSMNAGQRLLAHELAHVVQQSNLAIPVLQRQGDDAANLLEKQARAIESPSLCSKTSQNCYLFPVESGLFRPITPEAFKSVSLAFPKLLSEGVRRTKATIEGGFAGHQGLAELRKEQKIVAFVSSVLGGAKFPEFSIWYKPRSLAVQASAALKSVRLADAAHTMARAEKLANQAYIEVEQYRERSISGSERAKFALEITRDVSIATAGIIATVATGPAAGIIIGTGISTTATLSQQLAELQAGVREKIDLGGIAFDIFINLILSKFGGKLGKGILNKLVGDPRFATLGQKTIANLIEGEALTFFQTTARTIFDNLRGAGEVSIEEFIKTLAKELTDPKSVFMNILIGHMSGKIETSKWAQKQSKPDITESKKATTPPQQKIKVTDASVKQPDALPQSMMRILPDQTIKSQIESAITKKQVISPTGEIEAAIKTTDSTKKPGASSQPDMGKLPDQQVKFKIDKAISKEKVISPTGEITPEVIKVGFKSSKKHGAESAAGKENVIVDKSKKGEDLPEQKTTSETKTIIPEDKAKTQLTSTNTSLSETKLVLVNLESKKYHYSGSYWFKKGVKKGQYMSEAEAKKLGYEFAKTQYGIETHSLVREKMRPLEGMLTDNGYRLEAIERTVGGTKRVDELWINDTRKELLVVDTYTGKIEPLWHKKKGLGYMKEPKIKKLIDKGYLPLYHVAIAHPERLN